MDEARSPPANMLSAAPARVVNESEELLIERCRAGDPGAQRDLYDRHIRTVMSTARRLGLPPAEVEDVAQEVFTVAFRELGRVHPGALSAWLFRLVSNRVNDRHRRRRVRDTFARVFGRAEEPDHEQTPERHALRKDAERRVANILSRMTQKKREVFVLFELEEVPGEEIAARLGIPVDTVWTRLYHARRDFAKIARSLAVVEESRQAGGKS